MQKPDLPVYENYYSISYMNRRSFLKACVATAVVVSVAPAASLVTAAPVLEAPNFAAVVPALLAAAIRVLRENCVMPVLLWRECDAQDAKTLAKWGDSHTCQMSLPPLSAQTPCKSL